MFVVQYGYIGSFVRLFIDGVISFLADKPYDIEAIAPPPPNYLRKWLFLLIWGSQCGPLKHFNGDHILIIDIPYHIKVNKKKVITQFQGN